MREHARIEGGFEPLPQRGAIISNATGLIFEADDADSQLLHEPNSLYCDLTIDFPHLDWIGDSGRLEQEPALKSVAPVDEAVGEISAEPGNLRDLGFIDVRGGLDSPGAEYGATSHPHIVKTRVLDAELSKVSRALLGFRDGFLKRLDTRFALRH